MKRRFEALPRRIFLDSCTAQTLRDYGSFIYDGEPISDTDRINDIPDGVANIHALHYIFELNERAMFEWIVSERSLDEGFDKHDPGHMQWLYDISHHSTVCLQNNGSTPLSETVAEHLSEPRFGYLSTKDRLLLMDALSLRCEAFLRAFCGCRP